jgi:DNA-directed RNA polymerase subunit RPC12/RpoP
MYEYCPTCPLCKSEADYQISGLIGKYAQCKRCEAKWFLGDYKMELVKTTNDGKGFSLLEKTYPYIFWQKLKAEELEAKEMKVLAEQKAFASDFPREYFEHLLNVLRERGIVLEKIECPHCGGTINVSEVPKREEMLQCKYCGKSILAINVFQKYKDLLSGEN